MLFICEMSSQFLRENCFYTIVYTHSVMLDPHNSHTHPHSHTFPHTDIKLVYFNLYSAQLLLVFVIVIKGFYKTSALYHACQIKLGGKF